MTVYFVTLSLLYVSFVQQTVQHLVGRFADSTTDKKTGILWFPCFGMLFERLDAKMMGIIYTSLFTSPVFQLKKGKETCG